ncbi:MAG TPA: GGDEF domain-containing protein [Nitrospirota bacterium]|nr:GGDEF domain-containing protein [Nitrospirota bacterium]
MRYSLKRFLSNARTLVDLSYDFVRGVDYLTLSQYILKINKHKDIDAILYELSRCLKDILNYELFGFVLKQGNSMDLWIDPRIYSSQFKDYIVEDCDGQNIDCIVHNFENQISENSHISDNVDLNNLISYMVTDGTYSARLYILPQKKMLLHHNAIISTIISSINIALEKNLNIQQLESAAIIDPLTFCYNRRALDTFVENDIAYAKRNGTELSVIMLDLDDFKLINDVHGHLAGDEVLKAISKLISSMVRKSDYLVRYGGEEFVLVLPDSTLYSAVEVAHKIRKVIENHRVPFDGKSIAMSASFGVAALEDKQDGSFLLHEADERLYRAKSLGKNTVVPSLLPCFADINFVSRKPEKRYAVTGSIKLPGK